MRKAVVVSATVCCVIAVSALAFARSQAPPTGSAQTAATTSRKQVVIKACASKRNGALRIAKRCRRSELRVQWSKKGPRGATGPRGVNGLNGPAGATGQDGPTGASGSTGASGATGATGINGTSTGETLFAQVTGSAANFGGSGLSCTTTPSGPSTTFDAPAGSYVQIMAEAELQKVGGNLAFACLKVDSDAAFQIMSTPSLAFERRFLDKGVVAGTTDKYAVDAFAFPVSAGSHTISLQYGSDGGQSSFRNRKLWVTLFHPAS
jgi:hypothetical protein